ncbi:MAG: histidine--tRNA ligase [Deltaproteobacteria bacterium]|jgi:histidyl-tRNA synthetase|nr:histidine--tRNA ligase [Deltaproteobacteria bacterium]
MPNITAVRGFKDILPDQSPLWSAVENKARNLAARFGYQELRVPVLEKTELFARGIGEATDIVEKEMYTLEDRSGGKITLRPEATAGIVRAVIENNLAEAGRTSRFFFLGPMFRYERPQKGRQRQFHQLDAEVFGDEGPYIDGEVIGFLYSFLTAELGLTEVSVQLNSLGCPKCRPRFREELLSFLAGRKDGLCPDCQRRLDRNPLRVLDCKLPGCQDLTADGPSMESCLCPECRQHLAGVTQALSLLEIPYSMNRRLVRGLDYYSRTAFEVHSGRLGAQSAVAGGGRYDGLCRELGGPDLPAIGFAVGLERLILILNETGVQVQPAAGYYLAILCPEALDPAFRLASELRRRGLAVEADWQAGSLKSRLKRADRLRAAKVIMIGPDELASGQATIRDMASKDQFPLPLNAPEKY